VVAVVEAVAVAGHVEEGYAAPVVRVWIDVVDEGVLAPISDHEAEAEEEEGENVDEEGWAEVLTGHEVEEGVVCCFPKGAFEGDGVFFLLEEVEGKIEPDQKVKTTNVVEEVWEGVSLVTNGGAEIIWAIAFNVVVFNVMIIVGVPGVAH